MKIWWDIVGEWRNVTFRNPFRGAFLVIDVATNNTVGAGMIL